MAEGEENVDWAALEGLDGGVDPIDSGEHLVTSSQMAKRLLWDLVPCNEAEQVRDLLGYHAASSDVEDMEHRESHIRLAKAEIAFPMIHELSGHATRAIVGAMIVGSGDKVSEEIRNEVIEKQTPIVTEAACAIVTELIDLGFLHLPHVIIIPEEMG